MMSDASEEPRARARSRWVDLLVVLAVLGLLFVLLLPAINAGREAGRRAKCLGRGMVIGLSLQNYASNNANALPPSAEVSTNASGQKVVGGYSFLVKLLPFNEYGSLYKSLPATIPNGDLDAAMAGSPALTTAMNTQLPETVCPSNMNWTFQKPLATPPQFALTNYKAVGASTRKSLLTAVDPTATPPYGTAKMHPDGVLYPSDKNLMMSNLKDGTSHTILIMETIDDTNSRWMVGAECTLVGLPQASSPTGDQPAAAERVFCSARL